MSLELKVPPLLVALILGASMWLLARLTPGLTAVLPYAGVAAGAVLLAGVAVALAGVVAFRSARTTVDPIHPDRASAMVTGGVYALTRNPMYVGFLLLLVAWAIWLGNLPACLGLPAFVKYMNRFQILPEERFLGSKFGAPYAEYLLRVRRWI
jgi:protein-S-isoprenylcysteine O-methyltransferase Ste14